MFSGEGMNNCGCAANVSSTLYGSKLGPRRNAKAMTIIPITSIAIGKNLEKALPILSDRIFCLIFYDQTKL